MLEVLRCWKGHVQAGDAKTKKLLLSTPAAAHLPGAIKGLNPECAATTPNVMFSCVTLLNPARSIIPANSSWSGNLRMLSTKYCRVSDREAQATNPKQTNK